MGVVAVIACRAEFWPLTNVPMYSFQQHFSPKDLTYPSHDAFAKQATECAAAKHQLCEENLANTLVLRISSVVGTDMELAWGKWSQVMAFHRLPTLRWQFLTDLSKAAALQMTQSQKNTNQSEVGALPSFLLHFGPWLASDLGLCEKKAVVDIGVEASLSEQALQIEGPLLLTKMSIPCPKHTLPMRRNLATFSLRMAIAEGSSRDEAEGDDDIM